MRCPLVAKLAFQAKHAEIVAGNRINIEYRYGALQ